MSAARFSSSVAMIERTCASESETSRNRLSELVTCRFPLQISLPSLAMRAEQSRRPFEKTRQRLNSARPYAAASFPNVIWITVRKKASNRLEVQEQNAIKQIRRPPPARIDHKNLWP